jgi:hypothetical protein
MHVIGHDAITSQNILSLISPMERFRNDAGDPIFIQPEGAGLILMERVIPRLE